jgi:hypothetical protein
MDRIFAVSVSWWSNMLQFSPPGHLSNYLAMLIAKPVVWPTMLQLMYTNLKQKKLKRLTTRIEIVIFCTI